MHIKCEMHLISIEDCCKWKYSNIKVAVKIDVKNPNIIKDYNALLCNTITHNSISPATGALGQIE